MATNFLSPVQCIYIRICIRIQKIILDVSVSVIKNATDTNLWFDKMKK